MAGEKRRASHRKASIPSQEGRMTEQKDNDVQDGATLDEMETEESASLKKELAEQKEKAEAAKAGWLRAQADLINFRRRNEQEREDSIKYGNVNLILKILPVLDDFERAVASLPRELSDDAWVDGVKHISRKLRTILEAAGLSAIEAVGEPFDPRVHEAVREAEGKEGIVLEEAEKGYRFLDKVVRPSKVIVGTGEGGSG
jgi:molecular chaperone GrpE